jgi:hypothetical protein
MCNCGGKKLAGAVSKDPAQAKKLALQKAMINKKPITPPIVKKPNVKVV